MSIRRSYETVAWLNYGQLMRVTWDKGADAAYVYLDAELGPGGVAETVPLDEIAAATNLAALNGINLDFDASGRLVGIEVLGPRTALPQSLLSSAEAIS